MNVGGATAGVAGLRLLIDSNFFITLEPYAGDLERGHAAAAEVVRLAVEQGHKVFVHPATRDDLLEGTDPLRRGQRLAEMKKFPILAEGKIPATLTDVLGTPAVGSNDHRDLRLLAAVHQNAVAYLITNDDKLRRWAIRVGLGERILGLQDAVEMLRQLTPATITPPPRVRSIPPYALDADQLIFESLREDYDGFDTWLNTKVRPDPDNRDCLVIEEDDCYAGLAIIKRSEQDCIYPFPRPVTKIATFKVNFDYVGSKYGELLLKSVFLAARERSASSIYVEVLPKHEGLVHLLATFGFVDSDQRTSRGEVVLVKHLKPATMDQVLSALDHHLSYGPPAIAGTGAVFLVPIRPEWHEQLFPDAPVERPAVEQLELLPQPARRTHPWGNALRKAYLSNGPSSRIQPGDTLLFYLSGGPRTLTAVGVVEETLRTYDPAEVASFVGRRTVYTPAEIASMCASVRGVLAILFRQDRFLEPPWELAELQANGVMTSWPQSITRVHGGGTTWVHQRLAE